MSESKKLEQRKLLQERLYGDSDKRGQEVRDSVYSQDQLEQIKEQLRVVADQNELNEDEEFKLAESLAYDLSQASDADRMSQTQKEFAQALQRSYSQLKQQLEEEKTDNRDEEDENLLEDDFSLSYSVTQASRMGSVAAGTNTITSQYNPVSATQSQSQLDLKTTTKTDDQMVDSLSRSQLPRFVHGGHGQPEGQDEEAIPNSAAGQARLFYYGTDEHELSIKSQDFDDAYHASGQSQVLRKMRQSGKTDQSMLSQTHKSSAQAQTTGNQMTFGKDDESCSIVDSHHQMIEDSSNSMVNMAITMDPFSAEKQLRKVDEMVLEKQRQALLNKLPEDQIRGPTDGGQEDDHGEDYSADEFEDDKSADDRSADGKPQEDQDVSNPLKETSLGDRYAVAMHDEDDLDQHHHSALKTLLDSKGSNAHRSSMYDTSKFGGAGDESNTASGVNDSFDNAFNDDRDEAEEHENYVVTKPKRAQWGQQSFGQEG